MTQHPEKEPWEEEFDEMKNKFIAVENGEWWSSDEDYIKDFIRSLLTSTREEATALARREEKVDENTSDGYHTFKELYEFRLLYNANLFNEWAKQGLYNVHKSQRHFDGELCFGRDDYFVVVAELPAGQISNHYPMSDWELFKCNVVPKALAQWDGHTPQDVATRLRALADLSANIK